jgi:hypothetical protein
MVEDKTDDEYPEEYCPSCSQFIALQAVVGKDMPRRP